MRNHRVLMSLAVALPALALALAFAALAADHQMAHMTDAQIIGIGRNRTTAAGDRADAKTDPLVEAMGRQRDPHTTAAQGA